MALTKQVKTKVRKAAAVAPVAPVAEPELPPLVAVISDTHFGGFTSLCPPEVTLDDGGTYKASPVQLKLYEWWTEFWEEVQRRRVGRKLVIIHLGDIVDGNVRKRGQGLTNEADQAAIAVTMLEPLVNMANEFFILRGTEAHVGDQANSEVTIARKLGVAVCEYELGVKIGGRLFDLAHHGRTSSRAWGSAAASQAWEVIADCHKFNVEVPRFVLRGHRHVVDDSGERVPGTRFIIAPAWQLRNAYAHKVASTTRSDIGGLIIDGDAVDIKRFYAPLGRKVITV